METKEKIRKTQSIPHEIVFDILTRLPVKSLSRFRCVSKPWHSIISDRQFAKAHHNLSLTRPDGAAILITFPDHFNLSRSLYTVHDNLRENEEDPVVAATAVLQLTLPGFATPYVSDSLNGLICLEIGSHLNICNPITRQFITLPATIAETPSPPDSAHYNMSSFAYDPINNEHKVLNTWVISTRKSPEDEMIMEHRVFVLGDADSWRRIGDGPPHFKRCNGVCVNGVLFYRAWASIENPHGHGNEVLVAFDVRLETFRFIDQPDEASSLFDDSALISFDGHLAIVDYQHLRNGNNMDSWVLEDLVKPSWIHKTIVLSSAWTDIREEEEEVEEDFKLADTIHTTGEVVLAPRNLSRPFYLFYLDLKNASARRVEVLSLPDHELGGGEFSTVTVTDHVENILSPSALNY